MEYRIRYYRIEPHVSDERYFKTLEELALWWKSNSYDTIIITDIEAIFNS